MSAQTRSADTENKPGSNFDGRIRRGLHIEAINGSEDATGTARPVVNTRSGLVGSTRGGRRGVSRDRCELKRVGFAERKL